MKGFVRIFPLHSPFCPSPPPNPPKKNDTLPETNIAMENPPFWWYLPGKMGIFMGYVSFREGIFQQSCISTLGSCSHRCFQPSASKSPDEALAYPNPPRTTNLHKRKLRKAQGLLSYQFRDYYQKNCTKIDNYQKNCPNCCHLITQNKSRGLNSHDISI